MFPSRIASVLGGGTGFQNNYYVTIADTANLSFGDGSTDSALTFSSWVKMRDDANFTIISKYDSPTSSNREYIFSTGTNGDLYLECSDQSSSGYLIVYSGNNAVSLNVWHHLVATYTGGGEYGDITLYLDGSVLSTSGASENYTAMENLGKAVEIGAQTPHSSRISDGSIDNTGIWNTALSAGDIAALYEARGTADLNDDGNSANLVGWWRMGDGDTYPTITDNSTNSNDGTMTNMTASDIVKDTP